MSWTTAHDNLIRIYRRSSGKKKDTVSHLIGRSISQIEERMHVLFDESSQVQEIVSAKKTSTSSSSSSSSSSTTTNSTNSTNIKLTPTQIKEGWTTADHALVGKRIAKQFGEIVSSGTVLASLYDVDEGDIVFYFYIVYDDDDREEMEAFEVEEGIALYEARLPASNKRKRGVEYSHSIRVDDEEDDEEEEEDGRKKKQKRSVVREDPNDSSDDEMDDQVLSPRRKQSSLLEMEDSSDEEEEDEKEEKEMEESSHEEKEDQKEENRPFVLPSTWKKVNARLYVSPDGLRTYDSLEGVEQHLKTVHMRNGLNLNAKDKSTSTSASSSSSSGSSDEEEEEEEEEDPALPSPSSPSFGLSSLFKSCPFLICTIFKCCSTPSNESYVLKPSGETYNLAFTLFQVDGSTNG